MHDDIAEHLKGAVSWPATDVTPDLPWVVTRGKGLRRRRIAAAMAVGSVLAVALVGTFGALLSLSNRGPTEQINPAPDPGPDPQSSEALVEEVSEERRAEIFAFRALADTGLMSPRSERTYLWTYRDDTEQNDEGWKIGFAASRCTTVTCRGLSGEEEGSGNALTDTYVLVRLRGGEWEVHDVEGNMVAEHKDVVIGYSLPDSTEPSHWEFPAVAVGGPDEGFSVQMVALWVGPFETAAPGSVCRIQPLDSSSGSVGEPTLFYQEPPRREFEVGGWFRGTGIDAPDDAEDASVTCRQYTGRGWELTDGPDLVTDDSGRVVAASAVLRWGGPEGFTSSATCSVSFVDEEGNVLFEGQGRVEPLWRPNELRDHPYERDVFVSPGAPQSGAVGVEDFRCESR